MNLAKWLRRDATYARPSSGAKRGLARMNMVRDAEGRLTTFGHDAGHRPSGFALDSPKAHITVFMMDLWCHAWHLALLVASSGKFNSWSRIARETRQCYTSVLQDGREEAIS